MPSLSITQDASQPFYGTTVTYDQLGGNFLFNRVAFNEGTGAGAFDETAAELGIRHVRYPGGSMTEAQFDLSNPDNTFQPVDLRTGAPIANSERHAITPMGEFLEFARDAKAKASIVLPTLQYREAVLAGGAALEAVKTEVKAFITDLMSRPGQWWVKTLELGNEWVNAGFTAEEYGQVASVMAEAIREVYQTSSGHKPVVAIQLSQSGDDIAETEAILAQLSAPAKSVIKGAIFHNFRITPWQAENVTERKFSHVPVAEEILGKPLQVIISEWNVGNQSAQDGLAQAAGLLELAHQQISRGVDVAHVWSVFENNTTRLADNVSDPSEAANLMIGGEILQQMIVSLPGTQVIGIETNQDFDNDGQTDGLLHAYGSIGGGTVVFFSSLSASVTELVLDPGVLGASVANSAEVWATVLGVGIGVDPLSPDAAPVVYSWAVSDPSDLSFLLDPYEILRLEFTGSGTGVNRVVDANGAGIYKMTNKADVFIAADDGASDKITAFQPGLDRIDVSALGISRFEDLVITERLRLDASVKWIEIRDLKGDAELLLRLKGGDWRAERLGPETFIFADPKTAPINPGGLDTLRFNVITADLDAREVFRLADDDIRDQLVKFDLKNDLLDVSLWDVDSFDDLTIQNFSGANRNWIEISDADGNAELLLRLRGGVNDATKITAEHFTFANNADPAPRVTRQVDTTNLDTLIGTSAAEVFLMQRDLEEDQILEFDLGVDFIDVRAWGATQFSDLTLLEQTDGNGNVQSIGIGLASDDIEVQVRLTGDATPSASAFSQNDFVFL